MIRRVSVLLLTLALVVGFAAHGVRAAHMSATMVAMDLAMPDGCTGCSGDAEPAAACKVLCAGLVAVAPSPSGIVAVAIVVTHAVSDVFGAGLRGPPDPFPPRPTVLI